MNSATGYITPKDMLAVRQQEIHADAKLRIIDDGHSHIPIRATGRELVKAFIGQT